jgi:hypothetical protein
VGDDLVRAVVITTINQPNAATHEIAATGWKTIVVGDRKTPKGWSCPGTFFFPWDPTSPIPADHYAQKNRGYIEAIRAGAEAIAETDDDNNPYVTFLDEVDETVRGIVATQSGWVNIYTAFTGTPVWPRGLPLSAVLHNTSISGIYESHRCPIQQFLADGDPDVDAVYRLTRGAPVWFNGKPVILKPGTWSPFNSQNTVWWPEAYPYLYLPAFVSFRMTDIWRSFIAARCLEEPIAFHPPTVNQDRNAHDLMRDFEEEVPGYLWNDALVHRLAALEMPESPADRLRACYTELLVMDLIPPQELSLLEWWIGQVC